jgi:hypothetical protein
VSAFSASASQNGSPSRVRANSRAVPSTSARADSGIAPGCRRSNRRKWADAWPRSMSAARSTMIRTQPVPQFGHLGVAVVHDQPCGRPAQFHGLFQVYRIVRRHVAGRHHGRQIGRAACSTVLIDIRCAAHQLDRLVD